MSKKSFIDSVKVGEACSEDWEKMDGNDRFRFCSHCSKHVNNLSEMTRKEAARFVRASDGNICIRYRIDPRSQRPVFANQLHQITRRVPGITAGVMTASMALTTAAYSQESNNLPRQQVGVEQNEKTVASKERKAKESKADLGQVSGTLVDIQGAVIPSVPVEISGENGSRSTMTDADGRYEIRDLAPGTYTVRADGMGGFNAAVVNNVAVAADKTTSTNITLEVQAVTVELGGVMVAVEYTSALSRAVADEDVNAVRELISKGEKVNAKEESYSKITPLFVAVEQGNIEIVQMLLDAGAKVNARDSEKQTPLMRIDGDATPELIAVLIRSGAKVGLTDNEGNTALILSAYYAPAETLQALIDAGADINHANNEGYTALMRAAENGSVDTVKMLLEAGAQVNATNEDGDNAWDLTSNDEVKELLATYGSRIKIEDEEKPSLSTIIQ